MFPLQYWSNAAPKSSLNVWLGKVVKFQSTLYKSLSPKNLITSLAKGSCGDSSSLKVSNGLINPNSLVT